VYRRQANRMRGEISIEDFLRVVPMNRSRTATIDSSERTYGHIVEELNVPVIIANGERQTYHMHE